MIVCVVCIYDFMEEKICSMRHPWDSKTLMASAVDRMIPLPMGMKIHYRRSHYTHYSTILSAVHASSSLCAPPHSSIVDTLAIQSMHG